MCGIFGSNNIETFRELCKINSSRGNFVRSVTYLFPEGLESKTLVKTTHETDFDKPITENPFCVYYLGHVQSPTSKVREFAKKTSHPFSSNGKYLAHNGVLQNDRELIINRKLKNYNDVDSSIILPLIEDVGFKEAIESLEGTFGCWYYDSKKGSLRIFRSGSTLYYKGEYCDGCFSSAALPGYKYIDEGIVLEYNFTSRSFVEVDKFKLNMTPFFL